MNASVVSEQPAEPEALVFRLRPVAVFRNAAAYILVGFGMLGIYWLVENPVRQVDIVVLIVGLLVNLMMTVLVQRVRCEITPAGLKLLTVTGIDRDVVAAWPAVRQALYLRARDQVHLLPKEGRAVEVPIGNYRNGDELLAAIRASLPAGALMEVPTGDPRAARTFAWANWWVIGILGLVASWRIPHFQLVPGIAAFLGGILTALVTVCVIRGHVQGWGADPGADRRAVIFGQAAVVLLVTGIWYGFLTLEDGIALMRIGFFSHCCTLAISRPWLARMSEARLEELQGRNAPPGTAGVPPAEDERSVRG